MHETSLALATIVTSAVLEEFVILKRSFELFHGPGHSWFIRCDSSSAGVLRRYPNVNCHVFTDTTTRKRDTESTDFQWIVKEKTNVVADAWASSDWGAYQSLPTARHWIDKTFAVHCVQFLRDSSKPEHHVVFNEIIAEIEVVAAGQLSTSARVAAETREIRMFSWPSVTATRGNI
jgi:hypothetical protein